jgi:hypothetical protein
MFLVGSGPGVEKRNTWQEKIAKTKSLQRFQPEGSGIDRRACSGKAPARSNVLKNVGICSGCLAPDIALYPSPPPSSLVWNSSIPTASAKVA